MLASWIRHGLTLILVVVGIATGGVAAPQSLSTGPFNDLAGLDSALKRGIATRADIRRVFGPPNGSGAARFFSFGGDEREIWYYEDIEATGMKSVAGVMNVQMRQQMLVVMFKAERVDGYLWTSNREAAEIK